MLNVIIILNALQGGIVILTLNANSHLHLKQVALMYAVLATQDTLTGHVLLTRLHAARMDNHARQLCRIVLMKDMANLQALTGS